MFNLEILNIGSSIMWVFGLSVYQFYGLQYLLQQHFVVLFLQLVFEATARYLQDVYKGGGDTPLRPGSSSKTRFDTGA